MILLELIGSGEKQHVLPLDLWNGKPGWSRLAGKELRKFKYATGKFQAMHFEDMENEWKLDDGNYDLRLTVSFGEMVLKSKHLQTHHAASNSSTIAKHLNSKEVFKPVIMLNAIEEK